MTGLTQMLTFSLNPSGQATLSPALKQRACDRCRGRKTRCDGLEPCRTCSRVGVECQYKLPEKPKGRRPRSSKPQKISEQHVTITPESLQTDNFSSCTERTVWTPSLESPLEFPDTLNDVFPSVHHANTQSPLARTVPIWGPSIQYGMYQPPMKTFPPSTFSPYIELFFDRLYPILPVLDLQKLREIVAEPSETDFDWQISKEDYALLTSLSAAVILQLNLHNQECLNDAFQTLLHQHRRLSNADRTNLTFISAENFITHCLQARQQWDFAAEPNEKCIMTSFFLFEFYGNKNQSQKAWYYLREAIGFALAMRLDEPATYEDPPSHNSQRMFWLLFITERAYALQHRNTVLLRPSIPLPRVFDSEQPELVHGFVCLVKVFTSVDEHFLSAWKDKPTASGVVSGHQEPINISSPPDGYNSPTDVEMSLANLKISETQFLDISVTQKWLPLLQWQLKNGRRLTSTTAAYPVTTSDRPPPFHPYFPFKVSQDLLKIIAGANRRSLESHGIGMVSDQRGLQTQPEHKKKIY